MSSESADEACSVSHLQRRYGNLRELIGWLDRQHQHHDDLLADQVHAQLASTITALTMRLALMERQPGYPAPTHDPAAHWEKVHALLASITDCTRDIQRRLRPFAIDALGFTASLSDCLQQFGQRTGLMCTMTVTGAPPEWSLDDAHALLRIVQQALLNIEQHAHATKVELHLSATAAGCAICITDDGAGFELAALDWNATHGLRLMRERASLLHAQLTVNSTPGSGCSISISLLS